MTPLPELPTYSPFIQFQIERRIALEAKLTSVKIALLLRKGRKADEYWTRAN
jgi:hypothetical protein